MPFTPQSLPEASGTLIAHWAARLESYNDDDAVATFNAQSGTSFDADQSTEANKPTFKTNIINGQPVFRFDGNDFMESGAVTDWKFLHDNSEFTVYVVLATANPNPDAQIAILDTCNWATISVGVTFALDDSSGLTREGQMRMMVARGVSGQPVASFGQDYGMILGEFEICEWQHETGTPEYDWRCFNNLVATSLKATNDYTPSGANSSYVLNIGRRGGGTLYLTGDIAEILIYTGSLNLNDREYVRDWLVSYYYGVQVPRSWSRIQSNPALYDGPSSAIFTRGKVQIFGRRGLTHADDNGEFRRWYSDDFGASWSSETVIDDATYDDRGPAGGLVMSSPYKIVTFPRRYDYGAGTEVDIRILVSIDNGSNWVNKGTIDVGSDTVFAAYGQMIRLPSGKLMQSFYARDGTDNRTFVQFSEDAGETWGSGVDVDNSQVLMPSEGCAVYLSGATDATAVLLMVVRDVLGTLRQYKSTNGGATWVDQGVLPFSSGVDKDVSPWLFRTGDTVYLAYADRTRLKLLLAWGDKDDVASSVNNWIGPHMLYDSSTSSIENFGYPILFLVAGSLVMCFYDGPTTNDPDILISDINTEYIGPFATSKIV